MQNITTFEAGSSRWEQAHQYVGRDGKIVTEQLFGDRLLHLLYSPVREHAAPLFNALTGARFSKLVAYLNFDAALGARLTGQQRFLQRCGVDLDECFDSPQSLDTPRKIFERRIRYWQCRPMPADPATVVSPADARLLIGSFDSTSMLFIKEKFFDFEELIGRNRRAWQSVFRGGDFVIARLTPERYHYNHSPVSGVVVDFYEIHGRYHACNPGAVVEAVTPYSKNKRVVTILQTGVEGGSQVGLVAFIEIVALMIGAVEQCYSDRRYDAPQAIAPGMFLRKGQPKSRYRPGSSTDVVIFQSGRVEFSDDLARNRFRADVASRLGRGFGIPLVETDVQVRSPIGKRRGGGG
ncbi:MAG TPA: phosphatidylserine decarboxylase [Candidatus Acidoferrales bacterium]|nr:phosphatidylserine decarboxylase [Candidatus Acidoferrales bacterium]